MAKTITVCANCKHEIRWSQYLRRWVHPSRKNVHGEQMCQDDSCSFGFAAPNRWYNRAINYLSNLVDVGPELGGGAGL